MLRSMIRISFLVAVAVCLAFAGSASALTIGDINADSGSIIIGDKEFSGFSIDGIDPFSVNIGGYQVGDVVVITFGGPFVTTSTVGVDYQLHYTVEALANLGGTPIYMIDQFFNLSQGTTAGGTVNIGETVYNGIPGVGGQAVAQSSIGFYLTGDYEDPPGEVPGDQLMIDPALTKLWVTKDIFLQADEGGLVGATIIGQSFHQTSVPEPGILLLLGTGFAGLAFYARRKR